ncbi:winged helix domain-containing protein [Sulfitobacter delicatus]|uniref:Winged helix domain-containing protein n=1 Tax=Sulfitobacter delicatus TaxID=218672 RepID=A0A1G7P7P0_9RHOB|nr:hypothetical protein [Sulfitobacter delicatus]SDF82244.1 hypothetical protein SAMN04489759_103248 [Sulfitobacter delicatus]
MKIEVALSSEEPRTLKLKGRLGWAMAHLAETGPKGVTPITRPAPRWSGYVFDLRERGVPIDTIMEPHEGSYLGQHARYVLTCDASIQLLDGKP